MFEPLSPGGKGGRRGERGWGVSAAPKGRAFLLPALPFLLLALRNLHQRVRGGALLGDLLAGPFAAAPELTGEPAFDDEGLVVVGADGVGDAVFGEVPAECLGDLLKL